MSGPRTRLTVRLSEWRVLKGNQHSGRDAQAPKGPTRNRPAHADAWSIRAYVRLSSILSPLRYVFSPSKSVSGYREDAFRETTRSAVRSAFSMRSAGAVSGCEATRRVKPSRSNTAGTACMHKVVECAKLITGTNVAPSRFVMNVYAPLRSLLDCS